MPSEESENQSKTMSIGEDATVTSNGQVTIPKRVRETFGLEEGDEITIQHEREPMERLREVREQLAPHAVDVAALRQQAKADWSAVDETEIE